MEQELDRVDKLVKTQFTGLSRRQIEEAFESGLVIHANGQRLKKGDRLPSAEVDTHRLAEQLDSLGRGDAKLPVKPINIEADFAVVEKPAGMASEPRSLFDYRTVTHWAVGKFPELKQDFRETQPSVTPQPLDADDEGLVVVARNRKGYDLWRGRFDRREVTLSYLVWCWGEPKQHRFFVSSLLSAPSPETGKREIVPAGTKSDPPPVEAVTVVRIVDVFKRPGGKGLFFAELQSNTNHSHQMRVHMASRGYPVIGDKLYDAELDQRAEKPPQHLLLVSQMECAGKRYMASTAAFKSRFKA